MKKLIIPAICAAMLVASGCSTSKYTEARSIPVNDVQVFSQPLVASLNVEPIRKTWNVNNMRAYALAIACKDGNPDSKPVFDAVVGAIYTIKSSGKRYELEVTGYPATYSSFRNLEDADIETLKFSGQGESELTPVNVDEVPKFHIFKK